MKKNEMREAREEETLSEQTNKGAEGGADAQADLRREMKALEERYGEVCEKLRKAQEEAEKLREENMILRQNAANAAKAPVKARPTARSMKREKIPSLRAFSARTDKKRRDVNYVYDQSGK